MHFGRGPMMAPRRQRRSRDGNMSPMIMMLLMQIYQRWEELPWKPPVTFALVAWNAAAHVYPAVAMPYSLDAVCLSSGAVLRCFANGDFAGVARRLVFSAFTHADDAHLFFNVGSLLVKGVLLERAMGSEAFGAFCVFSILVSSALSVAAGVLCAYADYQPGCAVGFSAVLFSMKLVLNYGAHAPGDPAQTSVWGVRVAARHAHWLEILVSSYFNPRSSLVGHACGAAAGALWVASGGLRALLGARAAAARNGPAYTYAAGTAAAPRQTAPPPPAVPIPRAAPRENAADLRRRRVERFG